jgi:hypothetical protein
MSSIYEEHKDEDGFLYITYVSPFVVNEWNHADITVRYSGENTFGDM